MGGSENVPNRIQLIGYLEEALPADAMVRIEELLREHSSWRDALRELLGEIDGGEHSLATIWRRHRLTCPTRERLGALALDVLPDHEADYIRFHLEVIGCRWCQANWSDLNAAGAEVASGSAPRRRRIVESSVGHLPRPSVPTKSDPVP